MSSRSMSDSSSITSSAPTTYSWPSSGSSATSVSVGSVGSVDSAHFAEPPPTSPQATQGSMPSLAPESSWDGQLLSLVQMLELDSPAEGLLPCAFARGSPLPDEELPPPGSQRPETHRRALRRRCKQFFRNCCSMVRQTCVERRVSVAHATGNLVLHCRTIGKGRKGQVYGPATNF